MAFVNPPDWFDYLPLRLVVVLHDVDVDVNSFVDESMVTDLMQFGAATPRDVMPGITAGSEGPKPKFVALFPVGVGRTQLVRGGGWRCGHMAEDADLFDVDDVGFVIACVERLELLLANHYFDILQSRAGPIIDRTRRYAVGLGQGGQLCYRLAVERPGFFRAIAPIGCAPAGWEFNYQKVVDLLPSTTLQPATDDPIMSVLHLHGNADREIGWDGASPDHDARIQEYIVGEADTYNRIDQPLLDATDGVVALWTTVGTWTQTAGGPMVDLNGATLTASDEWTQGDDIVRLLVVTGLTHEWPSLGNSAGFDAIAVLWNFIVELET